LSDQSIASFSFLKLICQLYVDTAKPDQLRKIVQSNSIDWNGLVLLMQKHKLESILWAIIQKYPRCFPKQLRQKLFQYKQIQARRKIILAKEMARIQKRFQENNIKVLPYKGLCLAQQAYPSLQDRDCNDIDFAIEESYIPQSAEIMQSLGYEEFKTKSNFKEVKKSRAYYIDYSWVLYDEKKNIICNAEIHWQAANSALYMPFEFKKLESYSSGIKLYNQEVQTFSIIYQTLVALIHHAMVDTWSQLRHLVDFALLIQSMNEKEIAQLEKLLKENGFWICYQTGLYLCNTILDLSFLFCTASYQKLSIASKLQVQIENGSILGHWSKSPQKIFYYFRMRDSFKDQLKSLKSFAAFSMFELRNKF